MALQTFVQISPDVADDETKLVAEAVEKFGSNFDRSQIKVDEQWVYHYTKIIPSHSTERVVVFRAQPPSKQLGCIRVLDGQDVGKMIWDVVGKEGLYMGRVPPGSPFEAMLVEIKLITPK